MITEEAKTRTQIQYEQLVKSEKFPDDEPANLWVFPLPCPAVKHKSQHVVLCNTDV